MQRNIDLTRELNIGEEKIEEEIVEAMLGAEVSHDCPECTEIMRWSLRRAIGIKGASCQHCGYRIGLRLHLRNVGTESVEEALGRELSGFISVDLR